MKRFLSVITILLITSPLKGMEKATTKRASSLTLRELRESAQESEQSTGYLWALGYSPNGKELAVANDTTIKIFDLEQEKVIQELPSSKLPISVNFCADGIHLVSTGGPIFVGTDIQIWNSQTGECVQTLKNYFKQSDANTCSKNGMFCLHADPESKPSIWDIERKSCVQQFEDNDVFFSVALSTDTKQCAIGGTKEIVRIFDIETAKLTSELQDDQATINALAYSQHNTALVSGPQQNDEIKVWDLSSGKVIQKIPKDGVIIALTCSPDGKTVAYSQSADSEVHYFEINTGKTETITTNEKAICLLW